MLSEKFPDNANLKTLSEKITAEKEKQAGENEAEASSENSPQPAENTEGTVPPAAKEGTNQL